MSVSNDVVMPNDLSELCRVCLQLPEVEDCLDLTTVYDEDANLTYSECFTICTQIDLNEGDNLPHNLCRPCGLELQMSYDFYRKVEDSKRTLEQYKQELHEESNKSEDFSQDTTAFEEQDSVQLRDEPLLCQQTNNGREEFVESSSVVDKDFENSGPADKYVTITQNAESSELIDLIAEADEDDDIEYGDNKNAVADVATVNEEDACLLVEEHLDINEYHSIEALEDEETLQIKSSGNMFSVDLIPFGTNGKYILKEIKTVTVEEMEYDEKPTLESICPADQSQSQHQSDDECNKKDMRKWQENVVTVANREHLPVEAEDANSIEYTVKYDVLLSDEEVDVEKNDETPTNPLMLDTPKKRRIGSYTCEYCLKVYPNYSRMANHRRCHETDRPKFTCCLCGRVYATKQAMECHIQTEHEKTGFKCTVCDKVFAIRRSLEVHMRYHTGDFPYECNLCDKKFAQICHLNTHKNVKHNNVRFACDYPECGKFFTSSTSLRNHEFSHGVMPFECEYCQRGYPAKAKLKIHIKRKHNMDLSKDQLETMRKFHVMRSKVNVVQVVPAERSFKVFANS